MFGLRRKKPPIDAPAEIAGIRVKTHARARRLCLRVDMKKGDIVLTWPRGASERSALRFIEEHRDWIEKRRRETPAPRHFAEGHALSVCGRDVMIVRKPGRGVTALSAGELTVHARPEHLHRRVKDFLKETARAVLEEAAVQKQETLGLKPKPIRVADPKSRWGSCAPDGRMMFSWRLILAPPEVLDYVVAHEVAHRIHMNHSRKFWTLCAELADDSTAARRWLKKHGADIMAYN
jgi:predicted metal-dependent hydrolase